MLVPADREGDRTAFVYTCGANGHMDAVLNTVEKLRGRVWGQPGRRLSISLTGVRILARGLCVSTMPVFLRTLSAV